MMMNDEELESRLHALRPAPMPDALVRRLKSRKPTHPLTMAMVLGAMALTVMLVTWLADQAHLTPKTSRPEAVAGQSSSLDDLRVYLPIQQTSTLVKIEDIGLLETDPQRPIQLMRTTWLDDVTYRGDDGVSTLQRQESRTEIIPVVLHAY